MPLQPDPNDPAADENGKVRSHLFAAANTALPYLRGDLDMIDRQRLFLQQALRVDVTGVVLPAEKEGDARRLFAPAWRKTPAVKPGELVEAHVVVRNFGVGHRFPGGTIDSNEAWVEFQAQMGDAAPFYVSGAVDAATGRVDRSAEYYRAYWFNRDGKHIDNRIGPDMYTLAYVNVIGPGTADVVRYRFRVPEGTAGSELRLRARVRYRKFMGEYVDFLFGKEGKRIEHRLDDGRVVPIDLNEVKTLTLPSGTKLDVVGLPIVDISTHQLTLPVTAGGTAGPAPAPHELAVKDDPAVNDRERINDLAIGYLLQEEPWPAARLFEEVTKIDPAYVDGWVNVGRALNDAADFEGALRALRAAKGMKPGLAKAHFFTGEIHKKMTQFDRAEAEYRAVLTTFPEDRMSLRRLAEVLYEQRKFAESLSFAKRMLAIDPEDAASWFWALQCYEEIGTPEEVAAADAAFDRYRQDDDMDSRQGKFLLADPTLQRMQQPIHVHLQPGLVESER
jgi:tetratricopeptide (TPR) repeat protein